MSNNNPLPLSELSFEERLAVVKEVYRLTDLGLSSKEIASCEFAFTDGPNGHVQARWQGYAS